MRRDSIRPYVWMLTGCVAFTFMNAFVHCLRQSCDWQIIALCRTGLAFLFAAALTRAAGARLVFFRPLSLWIRSLAGSVSLACNFFSLTRGVPPTNVQAIAYVFPIWVVLLAWPFLGIKPGRFTLLSVATAVIGVFLIGAPKIGGPDQLLDLGDVGTQAALSALTASLATAVAMLGLHQLSWIDSRAVVAHFSAVSMMACLGALLWLDREFPLEILFHPLTILLLLGVGVFGTAGQICLTKAFTIGSPAKVSVVGLSQIVMMLVVDVCLFGEQFTAWNLVGIALVMLPTAWIMRSHRLSRPLVAETSASLEAEQEAAIGKRESGVI